MPKLISAFTGKNSNPASFFEIRLTKDVIVLYGEPREAPSQLVTGVLMLCLYQTIKVEEIYLRMSGHLKISGLPDKKQNFESENKVHIERQSEIFSHRWAPFVGSHGSESSSKGTIMHAGNYEWPFELIIPGSIAESVQGLRETYIVYNLKAKVARGKLAHDLVTWKPLRIIRTMESADADLSQPMIVENVWPNKVEYSVMVPQKTIIFGTAVEVQMRFTVLLKGLRIGEIRCHIMEIVELSSGLSTRSETEKCRKHERRIASSTFHMNDANYHEVLLDNGQDGHVLIEKIPLPKTLSECLQDCDVYGIKVRHRVKLFITLHNPDGHVSELRATIPITIYFSPSVPLTAEGELVDKSVENTNSVDAIRHAPPLYGHHVWDQLYGCNVISGTTSPMFESGLNTPLFAHSRAGSSDNLSAMDGTLSPHSTTAINDVTPAALSSRLQNLNFSSRNSSFRRLAGLSSSGPSTPHMYPNADSGSSGVTDNTNRYDYFQNATYHSNPMSRRGSADTEPLSLASAPHTPFNRDKFEMSDLNRVPSYRTASRTPTRNMQNDRLPDYETALSAPSSPTRKFSIPTIKYSSSTNHFSNGLTNSSISSTEPTRNGNPQASIGSQLTQTDAQERRRFSIQPRRKRGLT
ncbi:HECT-type ubiquitin ligase-interacting protein creD [Erysiphe neolycopersici]|uniref:HECT-type ubiquitin ligase-interacting protein creD n=1 Tax=Erysiphe neolycopersici TaxID=212602 RepID=A0A420HYF7_9PEZI|nr:HECT-type ubiquitin ligase-interacting protein creD [Erysiphe neolycopersici]